MTIVYVPELAAEVSTERHPDDNPIDDALCAQIGRKLTEHYPGWDWYVEIPPKQNVIFIRNMTCDPAGRCGAYLQYKDRIDVNLKSCVMAGGEILERYNMRRGRFTEDQTEGKIMHLEKPQS
jgi:hypothetical protein